jgi:RNA polymerase sigma-70 factor (ECF subfamily)
VRDGAPLPDETAELVAARELMDELLAKLSPELRRVLVLASIEQLALAEIAELEAIPQGTVASRLRRAREQFKAELDGVRHRVPFRDE